MVIETHGQYERGELDAYSELDDDDDVFVVGEFSRMLSRITLKGMTSGDDDDYEIIGKDKAPKIREEFSGLKKYTRNDKLNVKYSDGTIVKDTKFKKVENDLKSGKCSIID